MVSFVRMPKLGLTMAKGKVMRWLKQEGEEVKKGEPLVVVESDKSTVDYESPQTGIFRKILVEEGETVPILENIGIITETLEVELPDLEEGSNSKNNELQKDIPPVKTELGKDTGVVKEGERIFASPSARRVARENKIDLKLVEKRPNKIRIEKADVLAYMEENKVKITPLASRIAEDKDIDISKIKREPGERIYSSHVISQLTDPQERTRDDHILAVDGMRRVIANRMKESVDLAAQVSISTEVDMTNTMELRNIVRKRMEELYGTQASINDIILKVAAQALRENPRINSEFTDEEIIEKASVNIGVAVALDEGLIVPVVKDVDLKGIGKIAQESKNLISRAREGDLLPDEYSGGTFTVSNLGMFDITEFNSIINQPESAILSVGKIVERPVVIDKNIVIRPIMKLTLTFDHRPIDGARAAIFLRRVKQLLEEPYELLI